MFFYILLNHISWPEGLFIQIFPLPLGPGFLRFVSYRKGHLDATRKGSEWLVVSLGFSFGVLFVHLGLVDWRDQTGVGGGTLG